MKQHYNNPRFTSKLPILFIGIFILISSMSEVYAFVDSSTEADYHLNATEVLSNSVMEKTSATIALTPPSVSITCGASNSPVSPYVANAGGTYTIPNASLDATATSSDGGAITIVNDFTSTSTLNGAVFPIGATVVEWTATNLSSGEVVTCVQTINVVDNGTGPTANCKNVTVTLDPSGNASITLADIDNGSTGNIVLRTLDRTLFNCSHVGTNPVTLTVTDSNGNKDTCTATVTVENMTTSATVSVAAFPAAPAPICPGGTVNFAATPSIFPNVHYRWFIEDGISGVKVPAGTDANTFSTTSLNDKDKVTVEIRYGACNYLVKTSAPFEANVYPSTAVTAPTYLCVGGPSKTIFPIGGGTWGSSDVSIATVTNGGVITGVSAGIVSFTFTETINGCTTTTSDVRVRDLPVISYVPTGVCIGTTETAKATAEGTWISNNPAVATIDLNTGVITGVSVGTATFTFTDSTTGCISVASAPVTILELPWVIEGGAPAIRANYRPITNPISPIGLPIPATICLDKRGDATIYLVFDHLPGEGGSLYDYSWTASPSGATAGLSASAGTPSIENNGTYVIPTVTTTYTATAFNAEGCSVSNTITITVRPDPEAELVSDFCVGDPVNEGRLTVRFRNLSAITTPSDVRYLWTNDGAEEPSPVTTNHFTARAHHYVSAIITGTAGTGVGACTYSVGRTGVENLVEDGTFSYFDPDDMSFDTDLVYKAFDGTDTLEDEGEYCVGIRGRDFKHTTKSFYAYDHGYDSASGSRNFMIVNGYDVPLHLPLTYNKIWSQEIYVNAGTTYRMTAHMVNLHNTYRPLWSFDIDGTHMVIDPDPNDWAHDPNNNIMDMSNQPIAKNTSQIHFWNYMRVSHDWTAPTSGTITFSILNHRMSADGNDYGLDDISFGTFGQTLNPISPSGEDFEVCLGYEMDGIEFRASGHGETEPTVTGPAWVTGSYIEGIFTLSGIPPTAGTFPYTITTTAPCGATKTLSGDITVVGVDVDAGPDIDVCSNVPPTMAAILTPVTGNGIWSGGTGTFSNNSPTAIYTPGAGDFGTITLTYTTTSGTVGGCVISDTVDLIITEMESAEAGTVAAPSLVDCSDTTVALSADAPSILGVTGLWTVTSGGTSNYIFSDATSPTSTFKGSSGVAYTLTWTLTSSNGSCTPSDTVSFAFAPCAGISFDGDNNAVSFGDAFDVNGSSFSVEMWIKPTASDGFTKALFSKKDVNNLTEGYEATYVNDEISFYANNTKVVSAEGIVPGRWSHIVITSNIGTGEYKLYFDGVEVDSGIGPSPTANASHFLLGSMYDSGGIPVHLFKGSVDELRFWVVPLTQQQIREMMNQEIEDFFGTSVSGSTVSIPVNGLTWDNLYAYYQMNQGTPDVAGGFLINEKNAAQFRGRLLNMEIPYQSETAPLPYTTDNDGFWDTKSTWANQDSNPPNTLGVNGDVIDWNIVEIDHDINSGDKDITVSGLVVNSAGELTIMDPGFVEDENNPGRNLWVTNYLKLDGSIDLVGESQLIQKAYNSDQHYESILEPTSAGFIEKDQQGIKNSFSYNYWSPPVSLINNTTNNVPAHIEDILKDGTVSTTPRPITFGGPTEYFYADVTPSSPGLKVAGSWIYKFTPQANAYANWEYLGGNSATIKPTEGYTMKGTDVAGSVSLSTGRQNYVYRGKPNNAPSGVAGTPLVHASFPPAAIPFVSLAGNPFPSALDADQFLLDNTGSTDATLYFWEHWSNSTHEWAKYQGGYAIYKRTSGGVPAVSHPDVTAGGGPRNIPGAYVPVGQGFYVISSAAGGDVVFKNSQRAFTREIGNGGSKGASSVFIKGSKSKKEIDAKEVGEIKRIRLGFESPEGYHRQVLAAFFEGPTDGIDHLYDGRAGDFLPNDAFFLQEDKYFVIQAFGEYREDREIPISVFIDENNNGGIQKFMIDDLENIPDNAGIYIKDYHNDGETYDIRNTTFEIPLESGEHKDRFALVFQSRLSKLGEIATIYDGVTIFMNNTDKDIIIQKTAELDFEQVMLFNSLGQVVKTWDKGLDERNLALPVDEVSSGIYIINLMTKQGLITKKILIE